jgi:hypothetical protein
MLLGGEPFPEPVTMWWNFVARSRDEIESARQSWMSNDGRFGPDDSALATIAAPATTWSGSDQAS